MLLHGLRDVQTYRRADAFTIVGEIEPGTVAEREGKSVSIYRGNDSVPAHLLLMPAFSLPSSTRRQRRFMEAFAEAGEKVRPFAVQTDTPSNNHVAAMHHKFLSLVYGHGGHVQDAQELLPIGYKFEPEVVAAPGSDIPTHFTMARIALLGSYNNTVLNTEKVCELRG